MKTTCYCIYCPRHPLHDKCGEFIPLTGWNIDKIIYMREHLDQGVKVDCLNPWSDAFEDLDIDPESYEYPITAYDDDGSSTGFDEGSYKIYAFCADEGYEYKENNNKKANSDVTNYGC